MNELFKNDITLDQENHKYILDSSPEFKFSSDTRFDFLCDKNIIEVKNVTLLRDQKIAEFPDAVTERGTKHLKKLIEALKQGYKPFSRRRAERQRMYLQQQILLFASRPHVTQTNHEPKTTVPQPQTVVTRTNAPLHILPASRGAALPGQGSSP